MQRCSPLQSSVLELIMYGHGWYHRRMAMISPLSLESRSTLAPAAALFHSLGDQTRLAIVRRLSEGEARVVDLVAELGLAQATVSKHLACLRDCQLVSFRIEGRQSFYSLAQPALQELLAAAEQLLEATGSAVALCPN